MSFHTSHSTNIELSKNKQIASRTEGLSGICFGGNPVVSHNKIKIRVDETVLVVDPKKRDVYFGLTYKEPSEWKSEDLQMSLERSIDPKSIWKVPDKHTEYSNELFLLLTPDGKCQYGVTNLVIGELDMVFDIGENIYPVIQIAGNIAKLYFVEGGLGETKILNFLEKKNFILPVIPGISWKPSLLEQLEALIKFISEKSHPANITMDNEMLNEMVLASKNGYWDKCFDILQKIPHMINGIPQERAWSVLHQAVYQKNQDAVRKLLDHKNCDINIKAKQDRTKQGKPGFTPLDLAKKYHVKKIIPMISKQKSAENEIAPSFMPVDIGKQYLRKGFPYFVLAAAFMKKDIVHDLHIEKINQFLELTKKVYNVLMSKFKYIQEAIAETLYPFDGELRKQCTSCSNKDKFFSKLIWIYTTSYIYREVNTALRRATLKLDPTGDDLLLCLYTLFLQSVLLHWDQLKKYKGYSYRGMTLSREEIALYTRGTKFFWMNFTSSLKIKNLAEEFIEGYSGKYQKVVFIIDNHNESEWSPRELKDHTINTFSPDDPSDFGVNELVHPATALFVVKNVRQIKGYTEISIELQKPMHL